MSAASRLEVGRIGRAHGLRGEVLVHLTTDRAERLAPGSQLETDSETLVVVASRPHQQRWLVRFEGVGDREAADALRGSTLYADALPSAEDEMWVHELIGARVRDRDGRDLGTVRAVEANPASDLLVLDGERLLPLTFVVEHAAGVVGRGSARRDSGTDRADRRLHDLPRVRLAGRSGWRSSVGPAPPAGSTCASTTCGTTRATGTAASTTSPSAAGPGMVMMPEPIFDAVEAVDPPRPLYLLAASGRRFDQALARTLAAGEGFSLVCGRYEGVDQRVADHLCDDELAVGDVVLAGGEAAALVVIEAVTRLVPGVMGNEASAVEESFADGLVEHPQYTRPAEYRGWTVPGGAPFRRPRPDRALAAREALAPDPCPPSGSPRPVRARRRPTGPCSTSSSAPATASSRITTRRASIASRSPDLPKESAAP